jgi:ABC-type uncharacterized transport system permease subunit
MLSLKRTRAYRDLRAGGEKKGIADPAGFATFWSVCLLLCGFVTCLAGLIMFATHPRDRWWSLFVGISCGVVLMFMLWQKDEGHDVVTD